MSASKIDQAFYRYENEAYTLKTKATDTLLNGASFEFLQRAPSQFIKSYDCGLKYFNNKCRDESPI